MKLLLLVGLTTGSAEDLLLASQLQNQSKVDVSLLLNDFCEEKEDYGKVKYSSDANMRGSLDLVDRDREDLDQPEEVKGG